MTSGRAVLDAKVKLLVVDEAAEIAASMTSSWASAVATLKLPTNWTKEVLESCPQVPTPASPLIRTLCNLCIILC